nr:P-loop NTPase fold protein [Sphingopyxis granuli]
MVIGLEGRWGSGKSSLLHLIERELEKDGALPHSLVPFRPWLVSKRDALLAALFAELAMAIERIEADRGDATRATGAKAKRAVDAVRDFAGALGKFGGLVEVAGSLMANPILAGAGKAISAAGEAGARDKAGKPLAELKRELEEALGALDHRIIVTIDDLDRLEPAETIEVLRLARSVADLPNVVYLLCYDGNVIAKSIETAANIDDGRAFLEKIVQLTIMVPQPETFQLRFWFESELRDIAVNLDEGVMIRLKMVVEQEGGTWLTTPRAVNRALDSIRLLWSPLREAGLDFADLVWLQLLKDGNPRLYRWVEDYSAVAAEVAIGAARVDEQERSDMLKKLQQAMGEEHWENPYYRAQFAEHLPGIEVDYGKQGQGFNLLARVSHAARNIMIANRRLLSPDHYRQYFALAAPSYSLMQSDFDQFWDAADTDPAAVAKTLIELHEANASRPVGKADLLLERVGDRIPTLDQAKARTILLGFAEGLDAAYRARPFDRFWVFSLWDRAERLVPHLLQQVGDDRAAVLDTMFKSGASIGWLTSLYRHDVFFQGRFGDERKPESEWLFTAAEMDRIARIVEGRYSSMSLSEVLSTIDPRQLFLTWAQGGDASGPTAFIARYVDDDENFLLIVAVLQGDVGTTEGRFKILKRDSLQPMIGYEAARERVGKLAAGKSGVSALAQQLKKSFEDGDHF